MNAADERRVGEVIERILAEFADADFDLAAAMSAVRTAYMTGYMDALPDRPDLTVSRLVSAFALLSAYAFLAYGIPAVMAS